MGPKLFVLALAASSAARAAPFRDSGRVDAQTSQRTVVAVEAREKLEIVVRPRGFGPRLTVSDVAGTEQASSTLDVSRDLRLEWRAPRRGEYLVTVASASGGPGIFDLSLRSDAAARPVRGAVSLWLAAGGAVGDRGAAAAFAGELGIHRLVLSVRGDVDVHGGFEVTSVAGLGPRLVATTPAPQVEDDAVCVDSDCWTRAHRVRFRSPRLQATWPFGFFAGTRVSRREDESTRIAGVLAARWYFGDADSDRFSRSLVELDVSQIVAGRDRPFLRHAAFTPGFRLRAQIDFGVTVGGEAGITGLAFRDASGRLDPETYARAFAMVPLEL